MTDEEKKIEKMLERVRALLAQAAGTPSEEEAETARRMADNIMTKFAIELWQVEQAQGRTDKTMPVRKDLNIDWWWNHTIDREVRSAMWSILNSVASHARCRVVGAYTEYNSKTVPVVGLPSDVGYMDMLFTHLLLQMLDAMDPRPKPGEALIDALVRMKEAGLKWEEIHRRLAAADLVPTERWTKQVASKMNFAGKYTAYCRAHGKERTYTSPSIYRRSFVYGFDMELRKRLCRQVEERENTGSTAIALRDISLVVNETMWDMFPDLRPHPDDCDCDMHHECDDPKCMRPRCKAARSKRAIAKPRFVTIDNGIVGRGRAAGAEVQIMSNDPRVGTNKPKPLTS